MKSNEQRFLGSLLAIFMGLFLFLIFGCSAVEPRNNSTSITHGADEIRFLAPVNNQELEIGDNFTIIWAGESNEEFVSLVEKTYTSENEFSYGFIAKKIPFSAKQYAWRVPFFQLDTDKVKLALLSMNRTEIAVSDGFLVPVDNRPEIIGSDDVIIDKKYIFDFNEPFKLNGNKADGTNHSPVYSSGMAIQKKFAMVSVEKFFPDACDESDFYPTDVSSSCTVNGEQSVRIKMLTVHGSQGLYYTSQASVSLSSRTHRKLETRQDGETYQIELLSINAQKKEATIKVSNLQQ